MGFKDVDNEFGRAVRLANDVLDRPYADPDNDLSTLARQFLRSVERSDPRCEGCYSKGRHFNECTGYKPKSSDHDSYKDSYRGKLWSTAIQKAMEAPFPEVALQYLLDRVQLKSRIETLKEVLSRKW